MDFRKVWADYALYLPAVNKSYVHDAAKPTDAVLRARLPQGVTAADFNILDEASNLVYWPNTLYTATFAVRDKAPDIIKSRDRSSTFVLGDSGGFSLQNGAIKMAPALFRQEVLKFHERDCDIGIPVDLPTASIGNPKSGVMSFQQCLDTTIANTEFVIQNRSVKRVRFLTVYQGRDHNEAKHWAKAMEAYHLEGMAIAGKTRLDMWFWVARIVDMLNRSKFDHVTHIHFLGTSQPAFAVLATALQRALRKHVRENITVSFDSSLAFTFVQRFGQVTTGLAATESGFRLTNHTMPKRGLEFDPAAPFPYRGPLADRCTNGDFMPGTNPAKAAVDKVGNMMLSNHAVYAELSAILQANRLADMKQRGTNALMPYSLSRCVELIEEAFAGPATGRALTNLRKIMLRKPLDVAYEPERADDA
jgi:hypothetical protein